MAGFGGFPGFMINIFPIMFITIFVLIIGTIIFRLVQGGIQWNKNNNSPVLTVPVRIVSRRSDVSHNTHHQNNMHHHTSSTTYYVTFEFESGDRLELHVPDREYGYLVEGDTGKLTFQGTRYKGFERA